VSVGLGSLGEIYRRFRLRINDWAGIEQTGGLIFLDKGLNLDRSSLYTESAFLSHTDLQSSFSWTPL